jgi:hypothetical protein
LLAKASGLTHRVIVLRGQALLLQKQAFKRVFKDTRCYVINGYNALRRCLRVRQNRPACASRAWVLSLLGHCKTVIGFGSPVFQSHSATFAETVFFSVFYGGHAQGAFGRAGFLDRSTNPRMATTLRLVAKGDGS